MDHRYGKVAWGPSGTRVQTSHANWRKPIKWNKEAAEKGIRYRVFCASLADVFEDWQGPIVNSSGMQVGLEYRDADGKYRPTTMNDLRGRLFELIDATPNLDWLLLTKRPENIARMWQDCSVNPCRTRHSDGRSNVWLGTSVENQEYADIRIPALLECRDLSPVLWLSCEPLVGPVNLERIPIQGYNIPHLDVLRRGWWTDGPFGFQNSHNAPSIDWVITGGESGPGARPMHPDWFRSLRDHCQAANVPFHFKQWGEWLPIDHALPIHEGSPETSVWRDQPSDDDLPMLTLRVGVKTAGRILDDVLHDAFPDVLRAAI